MAAQTLTENQARMLDTVQRAGFSDTEWFRPMDVGGRNGSDHNALLTQLERKGLIESKQRPGNGGGWRGSKVYRLTEAGRDFPLPQPDTH